MISRNYQLPVQGRPRKFPSYDDFCDNIEEMIRQNLPAWSQTVTTVYEATEEGERKLTWHFYSFMDQTARELSVPWKFGHEDPRAGSRSEDASLVSSSRRGISIEKTFYAGHERFYAMEMKLLPTPPVSGKDRTREYVCGDWQRATDPQKPFSGGIERFKENKHGEGLRRSGMVAFIQEQTSSDWLRTVNAWTHELAASPPRSANSPWSETDELNPAPEGSNCHSEYESRHARLPGLPPIRLRHFWIEFSNPEITKTRGKSRRRTKSSATRPPLSTTPRSSSVSSRSVTER